MGTEVLRPQDCLVDKLRFSPPAFNRRKTLFVNGYGLVGSPKPNNYNNYYHSNRRSVNVNRPDRKRSPTKDFQFQHNRKPVAGVDPTATATLTTPRRSRSVSTTTTTKPVTNYPNPEVDSSRVTILRRGQSLGSLPKEEDFNNRSPKLSGKKPGGGGAGDMYAGSAIFVSPSPSSLPLPSFFSNNNNNNNKKSESDVSATRDLRRLLGLE